MDQQHKDFMIKNYLAFPPAPGVFERTWLWADDRFTPDELDTIVQFGESLPLNLAITVGATEGKELSKIRASKVSWISRNDQTEWLYQRIADIAYEMNSKWYRFDLSGLYESFQYTEYDSTRGPEHYDWHIDMLDKGAVTRKMSMIVQLSDPFQYEGGELWIQGAGQDIVPKKRGLIHIFPSFMRHRVTPVTKGIRRSLVIWVSGPEFR